MGLISIVNISIVMQQTKKLVVSPEDLAANPLQGPGGRVDVVHEGFLAYLHLCHDYLLHPGISKVDGYHLPLSFLHIENTGKRVKVPLQESVTPKAQDSVCGWKGGEGSGEAVWETSVQYCPLVGSDVVVFTTQQIHNGASSNATTPNDVEFITKSCHGMVGTFCV